MTRTIWKHVLPIPVNSESFDLALPPEAIILTVQVQGSVPVMWVDYPSTEAETAPHHFFWVGTGQPITRDGTYLATIQIEGLINTLVLHLYQEWEE